MEVEDLEKNIQHYCWVKINKKWKNKNINGKKATV